MERTPTSIYLWVSRAAGLVGGLLVLWAVIEGLTGWLYLAHPSTLVLLAIAAFLVAIWALLYEMRDVGVRVRK